jgi:small-conductance mechanosensitive channel
VDTKIDIRGTLRLCSVAFLVCAAARPADAPPPFRPAEIVAHLARAIAWYRHVIALPPASDPIARENTQRAALRSLQLAFDFGRAAAPIVPSERPAAPDSPPAGSSPAGSTMDRAAARAAERVSNLEAQLQQADAALAKRADATLAARRKELAAELNFAKQVRDSLRDVRSFLGSHAAPGADLLGIVARIERSVPELNRAAPTEPPAPTAPASQASGIFDLAGDTLAAHRARVQLDEVLAETETLRKSLDQVRAPLIEQLTGAVRRADEAAADSTAQTAAQMETDRQEVERLAARFKQLAAAAAPLREHGAQVDLVRAGLAEQRNAVEQRYRATGARLVFRIAGLILAVGVILIISEAWRRATFRYVRDPRRRKQFLLLRRVVVAGLIVAAVAIGLANEAGSLATYAGFLTAGLAVALQNPISSVVAYFFLIGRYGLKIGDRVTISGVTGDVVEIGLVRLYLMELTGTGADVHPTGRIVGFSNSVLFQPSAIFRQMPGAEYVWHSVCLTLAPGADQRAAESRLMTAVDSVYAEYRDRVEQQHAAFQRLVDVPVAAPKPVSRIRHTPDGLEVLVRYPVEMRDAADTDDRILSALSDELAREPRLVPAAGPKLQAA